MKVPVIPPKDSHEASIRWQNRVGSRNFRGMAKAHLPWGHSAHSLGRGSGPVLSHLVRRVFLYEDPWNPPGKYRLALTYLCGNQTGYGVVMAKPDLPPCSTCVEKLRRNPPGEWLDCVTALHLTLEDV